MSHIAGMPDLARQSSPIQRHGMVNALGVAPAKHDDRIGWGWLRRAGEPVADQRQPPSSARAQERGNYQCGTKVHRSPAELRLGVETSHGLAKPLAHMSGDLGTLTTPRKQLYR